VAAAAAAVSPVAAIAVITVEHLARYCSAGAFYWSGVTCPWRLQGDAARRGREFYRWNSDDCVSTSARRIGVEVLSLTSGRWEIIDAFSVRRLDELVLKYCHFRLDVGNYWRRFSTSARRISVEVLSLSSGRWKIIDVVSVRRLSDLALKFCHFRRDVGKLSTPFQYVGSAIWRWSIVTSVGTLENYRRRFRISARRIGGEFLSLSFRGQKNINARYVDSINGRWSIVISVWTLLK
jgi:hypothetical protein